jgi:hypothetical protein
MKPFTSERTRTPWMPTDLTLRLDAPAARPQVLGNRSAIPTAPTGATRSLSQTTKPRPGPCTGKRRPRYLLPAIRSGRI